MITIKPNEQLPNSRSRLIHHSTLRFELDTHVVLDNCICMFGYT